MAVMGMEDPESTCSLIVHFRAGTPMVVKTHVRIAREALKEWRKFINFYALSEMERMNAEKPYFVYHFLCCNVDKDVCASLLFQDISGMIYYVEDKKEGEK